MLRLFVRNNMSGRIHEYGTDPHDALILQEDGSLHYENIQCCAGTKYPGEGYSFCMEDGTIPEWDLEYGVEPYIDIAGEYHKKPQTNVDRIRAMVDEELAKAFGKYMYCGLCPLRSKCNADEFQPCNKVVMDWLQQPAGGAEDG